MKKVSEIMEELGFRPDGSDAVKKAFIKNLIKQANQVENRDSLSVEKEEKTSKKNVSDEQLSFFGLKVSGEE